MGMQKCSAMERHASHSPLPSNTQVTQATDAPSKTTFSIVSSVRDACARLPSSRACRSLGKGEGRAMAAWGIPLPVME